MYSDIILDRIVNPKPQTLEHNPIRPCAVLLSTQVPEAEEDGNRARSVANALGRVRERLAGCRFWGLGFAVPGLALGLRASGFRDRSRFRVWRTTQVRGP